MIKNNLHYQPTFKHIAVVFLIFGLTFCKEPAKKHKIIEPASLSKEDIKTVRNIPDGHKEFLARFLPEIHLANNEILKERNHILDMKESLDKQDKLTESQLAELNTYIQIYRINGFESNTIPSDTMLNNAIMKLLHRVDIIPVRLVMAQAIIESGWGSSSFAQEGNNYFGVHCYTDGCGVRPEGKDSANFYVKTYPSEMAGIQDYLWILNTGFAYRGLRDTRAHLRAKDKPINPIALAQGLSRYSEKGEEYVKMVSNIIRNYIPDNVNQLLSSKPAEQ